MGTFALPNAPRTAGEALPAGRLASGSSLGTRSQRVVNAPPYLHLEIGVGGKQRTNLDLPAVSLRAGGVRGKRTGRIMVPVAAKGYRHRSSDGVRIVSRPHPHHGIVRVHPPHAPSVAQPTVLAATPPTLPAPGVPILLRITTMTSQLVLDELEQTIWTPVGHRDLGADQPRQPAPTRRTLRRPPISRERRPLRSEPSSQLSLSMQYVSGFCNALHPTTIRG